MTTVVGVGKVRPDSKGIVETDNSLVIKVLKQFGFEEVKEKKEPKKK